jgi:hypothetical protein
MFRILLRTGKKLNEFIKLNLFVFVRDGGKCERFAFHFVPKKMSAKLAHPSCSVQPSYIPRPALF